MFVCVFIIYKIGSVFFTSRYYITRAKLVSKIAKYPHVVSEYYLKGVKVEGTERIVLHG